VIHTEFESDDFPALDAVAGRAAQAQHRAVAVAVQPDIHRRRRTGPSADRARFAVFGAVAVVALSVATIIVVRRDPPKHLTTSANPVNQYLPSYLPDGATLRRAADGGAAEFDTSETTWIFGKPDDPLGAGTFAVSQQPQLSADFDPTNLVGTTTTVNVRGQIGYLQRFSGFQTPTSRVAAVTWNVDGSTYSIIANSALTDEQLTRFAESIEFSGTTPSAPSGYSQLDSGAPKDFLDSFAGMSKDSAVVAYSSVTATGQDPDPSKGDASFVVSSLRHRPGSLAGVVLLANGTPTRTIVSGHTAIAVDGDLTGTSRSTSNRPDANSPDSTSPNAPTSYTVTRDPHGGVTASSIPHHELAWVDDSGSLVIVSSYNSDAATVRRIAEGLKPVDDATWAAMVAKSKVDHPDANGSISVSQSEPTAVVTTAAATVVNGTALATTVSGLPLVGTVRLSGGAFRIGFDLTSSGQMMSFSTDGYAHSAGTAGPFPDQTNRDRLITVLIDGPNGSALVGIAKRGVTITCTQTLGGVQTTIPVIISADSANPEMQAFGVEPAPESTFTLTSRSAAGTARIDGTAAGTPHPNGGSMTIRLPTWTPATPTTATTTAAASTDSVP